VNGVLPPTAGRVVFVVKVIVSAATPWAFIFLVVVVLFTAATAARGWVIIFVDFAISFELFIEARDFDPVQDKQDEPREQDRNRENTFDDRVINRFGSAREEVADEPDGQARYAQVLAVVRRAGIQAARIELGTQRITDGVDAFETPVDVKARNEVEPNLPWLHRPVAFAAKPESFTHRQKQADKKTDHDEQKPEHEDQQKDRFGRVHWRGTAAGLKSATTALE
jgi:hypothetical protein